VPARRAVPTGRRSGRGDQPCRSTLLPALIRRAGPTAGSSRVTVREGAVGTAPAVPGAVRRGGGPPPAARPRAGGGGAPRGRGGGSGGGGRPPRGGAPGAAGGPGPPGGARPGAPPLALAATPLHRRDDDARQAQRQAEEEGAAADEGVRDDGADDALADGDGERRGGVRRHLHRVGARRRNVDLGDGAADFVVERERDVPVLGGERDGAVLGGDGDGAVWSGDLDGELCRRVVVRIVDVLLGAVRVGELAPPLVIDGVGAGLLEVERLGGPLGWHDEPGELVDGVRR